MTGEPILQEWRTITVAQLIEEFPLSPQQAFDAAIKAQIDKANAELQRRRVYMRAYMTKRRAEGKA